MNDNRPLAMRDALLLQILAAMDNDPRIFFVCADFGSPVLDKIRERHPERFINIGIAEQNLINISAGLALEVLYGLRLRDRPLHHHALL